MTKKQKGFTLVELMIVVAIIGILAAVAIPKFAQMLEKSREGATKGNLGAIRSAVSNYYADQQGVYPFDLSINSALIYTSSTNSIVLPAFAPNYIDATLPGVKVTGKNTTNYKPGSGPGVAANTANSVSSGWWASPGFDSTGVGVGWKYDTSYTTQKTTTGDSTGGGSGIVWVNSSELGMDGISYTTYGFQ